MAGTVRAKCVGQACSPLSLKMKLTTVSEGHEPRIALSCVLLRGPRRSFQPDHKNLCQHCDPLHVEPVQHSNFALSFLFDF